MATTPPAQLDPVTRYATDVVEGRAVACRLVRLACQRHLNDLRDGAARGLVWRPDEAQSAIDFFPVILRLPEIVAAHDDVTADEFADDSVGEGTPFVLQPFQQFIVGSLFGWFTSRGFLRFRIAYEETGKGSGKTPKAGGVMIYRALAFGERRAQVYFAATKLDQAKIPFSDVEAMVKASPSLRKRLLSTVNNLADPKSGSFLRAISSEKNGLDGKRVSACHLEELHEHPTGIVAQKMRAGIKGRPNALILETTNAGFNRNSICWQHHEYSRQVLEGTVENDQWFAFVAQLDPCESCRLQGKLFPSDSCAQCDDWRVEGPHWLKANPNLGVSLPWSYLREMVREAIDMPSAQGMVKRLNFGIWTDQVTVWIPVDRWNECESKAVIAEALRGRECYIGLDLSEKIDLASAVFTFPRPIEAGVDVAERDVILRAIDVLPYFWMPQKTLEQRAKEDNIPYPDWQKGGWLFATTSSLIDHDAIVDFVIAEVERRGYRLRGIGVDQAGATAVVTRLQRHFGEDLVTEVPQGFRMLSSPSKTLEALVMSGNVAHNGNPVMAMCVGNMGKEENHWREIRPVKIGQRKRIDGGVALIDGICVMERTPGTGRSKYETAGLTSIG